MKFNEHYNLKGKHALFSASQYSWLRYDDTKIVDRYFNMMKAEEGTQLHELASNCIVHGRLQAGDDMFAAFVNDSIGYKMKSEQILYFTDNFFGTADSICFMNNILRIFDLKTGTTPVHMDQLMIYAALFCLEYGHNPKDITIELRIYQENEANEVMCCNPDPEDIEKIMTKMINFNKIIENIKKEG